MTGRFVSFEGLDGAGKTTQLTMAAVSLAAEGIPYVMTREPGGTEVGLCLRRELLSDSNDLDPSQELILYQADRVLHVSKVIKPAIQAGIWVLCDRFIDSTMAYQGFGRGCPLSPIKTANQIATGGIVPDLTVLLDMNPEAMRGRLMHRQRDRVEREDESFFQRVREGFLKIAAWEPERFMVIDAGLDSVIISAQIAKRLKILALGASP